MSIALIPAACQVQLDAWCNKDCAWATSHGPLVALYGPGMQGESAGSAYRCYAPKTLDKRKLRYVHGSNYCTRHAPLKRELDRCLQQLSPPPPPPPPDESGLSLFVSITTVPARLPEVGLTVLSFASQRKAPRKVLVSAARRYERFPDGTANLSVVHAQLRECGHPDAEFALSLLETHVCERDDGPGTKLLCVLHRLEELVEALPREAHDPMVILADDDRRYRPSALQLLETAVRLSPRRPPAAMAYSFFTYKLPLTDVNIGQGADLYAMCAGCSFEK